jgi:hypothetical protein
MTSGESCSRHNSDTDTLLDYPVHRRIGVLVAVHRRGVDVAIIDAGVGPVKA